MYIYECFAGFFLRNHHRGFCEHLTFYHLLAFFPNFQQDILVVSVDVFQTEMFIVFFGGQISSWPQPSSFITMQPIAKMIKKDDENRGRQKKTTEPKRPLFVPSLWHCGGRCYLAILMSRYTTSIHFCTPCGAFPYSNNWYLVGGLELHHASPINFRYLKWRYERTWFQAIMGVFFSLHKVFWVVATRICLIFSPKIVEDEPILTSIFFKWVI